MDMRIRRMLFLTLASACLVACAQASAANPDPSQDIDCSVVTFYFSGLAKHEGAEAAQQRALSAVSKWYAAKVETLAKQNGANQVLNRAGPLLEAVKRDPMN